jgi:hypothetical protein
MKIKGKFTINIKPSGANVEITCDKSRQTFVKIHLTPEELTQALSGLVTIEQEIEVEHLERVGKTQEHKTFEFELPEEFWRCDNQKTLKNICESYLTDRWVCDDGFNSKNSFYKKGDKFMACCVIRRWI